MAHFTDHKNFSEAFIGFSVYARDYGFNIGMDETLQALHTAFLGLWHESEFFKYALSSIYCRKEDDRATFENIFNNYWGEKRAEYRYEAQFKNQSNLKKQTKGTLVMLGQKNEVNEQIHQTKTTSGANYQEALRKTDFSLISKVDETRLNEISDQLVREMMLRISRKYKKGKQGKVDLNKTIRYGISQGGNLFRIFQKEKIKQKLRLVLLLDVSGSMDKYSFYLLKFIWILRKHFSQVEAFTFSTKLIRITDHLKYKNIDQSLTSLGHDVDHWSSGTKIGECLQTFINFYGKRVLNGRTLTIILSDGLDTGDPELLDRQLRRIRLKTKQLVWLNPLKGSDNYLPIQKGMKAALPHLDIFQSAHNLESLLTLEKIISHA